MNEPDAELKVMTWYDALVAGMNPSRKVAAIVLRSTSPFRKLQRGQNHCC